MPKKVYRVRVNGKIIGRYNTALYASIQRRAHEAKGRYVVVEYWCANNWRVIYASGADNRLAAQRYATAVVTGTWPSVTA